MGSLWTSNVAEAIDRSGRAEEAADFVDALRSGIIVGDFDLEMSVMNVKKFRIRQSGKEHTVGNIDCPGCGTLNGIRYPHPHHEAGTIIHLEFLVHGEAIYSTFYRYCEGGCALPPIELAPKPRKKPPDGADLLRQLEFLRDGLRLGTTTIRRLRHHQKVDVHAVLRRLALIRAAGGFPLFDPRGTGRDLRGCPGERGGY